MRTRLAPLAVVVCVLAAAAPAFAATAPGRCLHYRAQRSPFFGDLHVHTAFSQDASTQGTRNRPAEAYAFARGAAVGIQPYDATGAPRRTLRLTRPLDFAAVTDHAEQLGETQICATPTLPGYDSWMCRIYRRWPRAAFFLMNIRATYTENPTRFAFCGEDGRDCLAAARTAWNETIEAAERAYDRSDRCSFTTFIGYEWTWAPGSNNLHRNVIFANDRTVDTPTSVFEAPTPQDLWRALRTQCLDRSDGCDALIIPHNSNLSGGLMFETRDADGIPLEEAYARERAALEPLVEVLQHKGDSECLRSPTTVDEYCDFEKLPYSNFRGKYVRGLRRAPVARGFVRDALRTGLAEGARTGVNPFKFGLIGSTDTHLAAAGAVEESQFVGHGGAGVPARDEIPEGLPDDLEFNPGGLAVLWAEENTRESLFAAMKRKEAYGTSGPRFVVRLFAGWSYGSELCEDSGHFAERGYAGGVPMGGDLPPRPRGRDVAAAAPRIAIWALADPGIGDDDSVPLARLQIVKGWLGEDGLTHERVHDVAAAPDEPGRADVDPATCRRTGDGPRSLCTVWTDPDFRPDQPTFYYGRVLQSPTCRWSQRLCAAAGVRCDDRSSIGKGYEACCSASHRPIIQERAWTSPIWYTPSDTAGVDR
jgi:hypothetical protein